MICDFCDRAAVTASVFDNQRVKKTFFDTLGASFIMPIRRKEKPSAIFNQLQTVFNYARRDSNPQ